MRDSLKGGIPFWNFFTPMSHGPHTNPIVDASPKTGRGQRVRDDSPDIAGLQLSFECQRKRQTRCLWRREPEQGQPSSVCWF